MPEEHKIHKHIFSFHNMIWYGLISAAIIVPTGLYKKVLPHPVINENVIYLLKNNNEEIYCNLQEGELPWRFSKTIECKTIVPGKEEIKNINLKDYEIIKTGK